MAIGNCDCCDRQSVPVHHFTETYCGDVTACFICQGDSDPDPYGELEEASMQHFSEPEDDIGPMLRDLDRVATRLEFTNPIQLAGEPERTIITGAILALTIVQRRIDALQPQTQAAE